MMCCPRFSVTNSIAQYIIIAFQAITISATIQFVLPLSLVKSLSQPMSYDLDNLWELGMHRGRKEKVKK